MSCTIYDCLDCKNFGTGMPTTCPNCNSKNVTYEYDEDLLEEVERDEPYEEELSTD